MKQLKFFLLICASLNFLSCGKDSEAGEEKVGVVKSGWNSMKYFFSQADSLVIEKPYQYFKDRSRKSDSTERARIEQHFSGLRMQYPDYNAAEKWFKSNPPELLSLEGNYYKITEGIIQQGKSRKRLDFTGPTDNNIYKYFYETDSRFFILELEITDTVICKSVRCILDGWGDQPMYDYLYDENGKLVQEIFQAEVDPSFYEEDGILFFKYSKESNDEKLINTVVLGKSLDV